MGQPEQFVKQLFEEETAVLTGGGAVGQGPVELGLSEVRLDRLLRRLAAERLAALAAPWSLGGKDDEVVLELKLAGTAGGTTGAPISGFSLRMAPW
jgi:hypothetical protein